MPVLAGIMKGAQPCFFETFIQWPVFNRSGESSMWPFTAAAVRNSEYFSIAKPHDRCVSATLPQSAAASSALKSRFIAMCTLQPLLSNCQVTSRRTLQAAALAGILPSIPVVSTLNIWSSINKNFNAAIKE